MILLLYAPLLLFFIPIYSQSLSEFTNERSKKDPARSLETSALFSEIITKYNSSSGVTMNFQKKTYLKLLQKHRFSTGKIFLSKGQVCVEVTDSMNTRLIFNKHHLWHQVSKPSGEIKTLKINLKKEVKNQAIISFLFNPDKFFQMFQFTSNRQKGRAFIFDFRPSDELKNINHLSVKIENRRLLQLRLEWKDTGNWEEYKFSDIRMNQKIPGKAFKPHKSS